MQAETDARIARMERSMRMLWLTVGALALLLLLAVAAGLYAAHAIEERRQWTYESLLGEIGTTDAMVERLAEKLKARP
jgi:uncharacterized membrane protein YgdD (TMEM256/DUF423 family)